MKKVLDYLNKTFEEIIKVNIVSNFCLLLYILLLGILKNKKWATVIDC